MVTPPKCSSLIVISLILLQIIPVISAGKILVLVDTLNIRETHSIFLKSLKGKQQIIY